MSRRRLHASAFTRVPTVDQPAGTAAYCFRGMRVKTKLMWRLAVPAAVTLLAGCGWLADPALSEIAPERRTYILYDADLGTLPGSQGFVYLSDPSPAEATQEYDEGATVLDTTAQQSDKAGYFASPLSVPVLNHARGFTVAFTVQIESEAHSSEHRAGFSVIVLGDDLLGIELGFWEDRIWAQEGGEGPLLFTQAEYAPWDTVAGLVLYRLAFSESGYTLSVDEAPVLTGALRDYTAFTGQPDPYEIPNLVFIGDNTSSADARVRIAAVSITVGSTDN